MVVSAPWWSSATTAQATTGEACAGPGLWTLLASVQAAPGTGLLDNATTLTQGL